jgi:hypothetical protein
VEDAVVLVVSEEAAHSEVDLLVEALLVAVALVDVSSLRFFLYCHFGYTRY